MNKPKTSKNQLKKCQGYNIAICRRCRRSDPGASERLVMGLAHGKCIFYIDKKHKS